MFLWWWLPDSGDNDKFLSYRSWLLILLMSLSLPHYFCCYYIEMLRLDWLVLSHRRVSVGASRGPDLGRDNIRSSSWCKPLPIIHSPYLTPVELCFFRISKFIILLNKAPNTFKIFETNNTSSPTWIHYLETSTRVNWSWWAKQWIKWAEILSFLIDIIRSFISLCILLVPS